MNVSEAMCRDVGLVKPDQTIQEAAAMMYNVDAGAMPVRDGDRLVGIITDRDIAVRAVANGRGPDTPVSAVMSDEVCYCFDDQDLGEIGDNMAEVRVRRLPVLNRDKRLVGILALADIARAGSGDEILNVAISGISAPGGQHSQSAPQKL